MSNTEEKEIIMKRLVNLRAAEDEFQKLSVRDDYTLEERQLIKVWLQKASEKNKAENTKDWKVRGSPKNGLRLVKLTKRVTEAQATGSGSNASN